MMPAIGEPAAGAVGCFAKVIRETARVSPRFVLMPAMLATDFCKLATVAAGTLESTSSATSSRLTVPGATVVF